MEMMSSVETFLVWMAAGVQAQRSVREDQTGVVDRTAHRVALQVLMGAVLDPRSSKEETEPRRSQEMDRTNPLCAVAAACVDLAAQSST